MQKTISLSVLLALTPVAAALAETPTKPDTSQWVCELCPFSDGLNGSVAAGPGYVTDDNPDFGNFGGLEEEGAFVALDGDLWYRNEDGGYFLVYGDRLGLDSRELILEGGRQGSFRLGLDYAEIPWVWSDDARTYLNGAGTASQTLPSGWVTGNTSDMSLLVPNLRDIRIGHQRETVGLSAALTRPSPWRTRVDFEQTRREGNFVKGASFLFTGTELVAPLDQETTLVEAAIGYVRPGWQIEGAYQVSLFETSNASVRWDNPFPAFNGGSRGELSLAPDNEFHQFVLTGSWRLTRNWNVAGQVAFGRATQDELFLAPTLNTNLNVPTLPATSL
ncbi:MAG: MtrB/PioB family outer membrane beta-barrel protein, partial [Wenzhouxiangella sp.]|nr:MtrB/PioB family outer membrane beta-barrel protein [Wenzhouxiangella sp.]